MPIAAAGTWRLSPISIWRAVLTISVLFAPILNVGAEDTGAPPDFMLRSGDRVVFYGDSITEQGHYTRPIETYVLTRLPHCRVEFINSGWAGDRVWGGEGGTQAERLRRDVIAHRPSVVTIMFGMNDAYYTNFDEQSLADFRTRLDHSVTRLKSELPDSRITLLGASPYDNITPGEQPEWEQAIAGGYNSVVVRYSSAAEDVARKHDLLFVDFNEPVVRLLQSVQHSDPALARQLIPDRIHPGPVAGLVMAARLLQAWNAPQANQPIVIDMASARSRRVRQKLLVPFLLDRNDALTRVIMPIAPDLSLFAGDRLRVTNLAAERALLHIDGERAGAFSASQLSAGIELSAINSAISRRAAEISQLVEIRNQLQFTRRRRLDIQPPQELPPAVATASKELLEIENILLNLQLAASLPSTNTIEITPIADRK